MSQPRSTFYTREAVRHEREASEKRREGRCPEGSDNAALIMRQFAKRWAEDERQKDRAVSPQGVLL